MHQLQFKILFVCTGNICRSPTAEGIMQNLINKDNLENKIFIDSAGTSGWNKGNSPDERSVHCAKGFGIDLTYIRSRPITEQDFETFDLILVMDDKNIYDLQAKFPCQYSSKVKKLLDYASSWGENVPDPYYNDGFDHVFMMIEDACKNLLEEIKKPKHY